MDSPDFHDLYQRPCRINSPCRAIALKDLAGDDVLYTYDKGYFELINLTARRLIVWADAEAEVDYVSLRAGREGLWEPVVVGTRSGEKCYGVRSDFMLRLHFLYTVKQDVEIDIYERAFKDADTLPYSSLTGELSI